MKSKSISRIAVASVATVALFGSAQLMADCLSVEGKILNSLHKPALGSIDARELGNIGGISTVGVVNLEVDKPIGELKCALVGVAVGPGKDVASPLPPLPDFEHTISCDDQVEEANGTGTVHSQLTFDTRGYFTGFDGPCTLFFTENSEIRAGSGKGVFDGTTGGDLTVEGTSNICTGSIDMEFTGEVCME